MRVRGRCRLRRSNGIRESLPLRFGQSLAQRGELLALLTVRMLRHGEFELAEPLVERRTTDALLLQRRERFLSGILLADALVGDGRAVRQDPPGERPQDELLRRLVHGQQPAQLVEVSLAGVAGRRLHQVQQAANAGVLLKQQIDAVGHRGCCPWRDGENAVARGVTACDAARVLTAAVRLDDDVLAEVADLERRVVAADGGRLKLEWGALRSRAGDRVSDFVWRVDGRVVGFCGLYLFGRDAELAGMVDPPARRQGIGSALLAAAMPVVASMGREEALLVTPRTTPAGGAFARAHAGRLHHSEHHLVLGATPPPPPTHRDVLVRDAAESDVSALRRILTAAFGHDPGDFQVAAGDGDDRHLALERDGAVIGCLRLSRDDGGVGIYGFAIESSLRGGGIGRAVLSRVCRDLRAAGVATVTLEVETTNERALGLYTSCGFERQATEDYYAVPASARSRANFQPAHTRS